jgi:hypothetical protein
MEKTDSLLMPFLRRLGIESGAHLARIKENWHAIFAEPLSAHMYPARLSDGEILLNVDSPLWMQQLSYHKREIISKLSSYGVREVRFRTGRIPRAKHGKQALRRYGELSPEDAAFVEDLLPGIRDNDLRNAVKSAAEKSLTSGRSPRKDRF